MGWTGMGGAGGWARNEVAWAAAYTEEIGAVLDSRPEARRLDPDPTTLLRSIFRRSLPSAAGSGGGSGVGW
jgi:hypothetical protein